jgi:hypothetical protein
MSTRTGKACAADTLARRAGWPLERVLFAIAGSVVIVAAVLSAVVSAWFLLLVGFVGVNQWMFVLAGDCPMSLILTRAFHLKRGMPQ